MVLRLGFGRFGLVFAALLALSLVPLFLTPLPPLLDYPNHLARMYLLPHLPAADLQQFYVVRWAALPNLGMDGIVPFLAMVMPLEWAGKLFVALVFVLLAGGAAALHRALFGGWSAWPLLAFLLLYTRLLLWGFMGYLFGAGLAVAAFAGWVALSRRHWALRLAFGFVCALAIYLAHLLAFGLYAVLIASYEFGEIWRLRKSVAAALRDLAVGGIPFLPALALMAANSSPGRIVYGNPWRKLDLTFAVFDNYSRPFDVTCFALAVLVIGYAFARRWVRIAPAMAVPLLALVIAYLAMPTQLFTAAGVDRRVPMVIFLVLIGGSAWELRFVRCALPFLAGFALMFLVRLGVTATVWQSAGELYTDLMPALDALPRDSCIATAFGKDSIQVSKAPLTHFTTLAVPRRHALVTTFFHYPTQQPIEFQPRYAALADLLAPDGLWYAFVDNTTPLTPPQVAALRDCGYVAFSDIQPFRLRNSAGLTPVFLSPRYQIYRAAAPGPSP